MMRADENMATLANLICHAHSIKGADGNIMSREAFIPWREEPELTLEVAMSTWR